MAKLMTAQSILVLLAAGLCLCVVLAAGDSSSSATGSSGTLEASTASTDVDAEVETAGHELESQEQEVEQGGSRWRRAMQQFAGFVRTSGRKGYCGQNPSVCTGTKGKPHCCSKFCTNLKTDKNNCGKCGRLCSKGKACCGGVPVNLNTDPLNCGRCGSKCQKNEKCSYGLCNYAGPTTSK